MTEDEFVKKVFEEAQSDEIGQLADELIREAKATKKHSIELNETELFNVIKASYIADRFFGKSRFWISQKINHSIKNGKPTDFTEEERKTLKNAIETIAEELQELADNM